MRTGPGEGPGRLGAGGSLTSLYPRRSVAAGLRSLPPPQGASREGGPGVASCETEIYIGHGA
jgi:hypothetical protein